ncbi:DUF7114 family protein [Natronorubrum halophilum]|uniref:DUF7114 family protein n=1 Tax=Natronorubrum halophilum TaxID=1702106 RepID=UPI0010C1DCF8|nr:hypothetical protein [Natronorubrum halophilum]
MEKADSCRRAASEAVADVEPPQLHDHIETTLEEASMLPGVLTIESAAATADGSDGTAFEADRSTSRAPTGDHQRDRDTDRSRSSEREFDGIATQAAGVQLIYEGLRLTRALARDEPWAAMETDRDDTTASDLEILAADILVARGFYLLARTDAAGKAVRTVQAFGRDQSRHGAVADADESERESIDANLERDILELAVLTGAAAVGDAPSSRLLATADAIADAVGASFPPAGTYLVDPDPSRSGQSLEDHTTDRATSATDP